MRFFIFFFFCRNSPPNSGKINKNVINKDTRKVCSYIDASLNSSRIVTLCCTVICEWFVAREDTSNTQPRTRGKGQLPINCSMWSGSSHTQTRVFLRKCTRVRIRSDRFGCIRLMGFLNGCKIMVITHAILYVHCTASTHDTVHVYALIVVARGGTRNFYARGKC
jgi:hypothetical protein